MLKIENFKIDVNKMGHVTNTYLLYSDKTNSAILFDPAGDEEVILNYLASHNLILKYIILTHCHGDHIFGIDKIKKITDAKIIIHKAEENGYYTDAINCCSYLNLTMPNSKIDITVKNHDIIAVDDITLEVIHTPGHTKGGMCLYQKELNILFSGDTIFSNCYGRTDLETGNFEDMKVSLEYLFNNFKDTVILPGHGDSAIIKDITRKLHLLMKIKQK